MTEEYFDILDENGDKTGKTKLRSEVHRDGDWHKSVHIWILNKNGDILLQRRSSTKDSWPNMLDISCAGHLSAGDDSITGAIREIKEELNLEVKREDLKFIKTIKSYADDTTFIDNEFDDIYILETTKKIDDMKYQEDEISEIFYVPCKTFKKMVINKQSDLAVDEEDIKVLFNHYDSKFTK